MARLPDNIQRGAGADLKAFSPRGEMPETFYPEDVISKHIPIQDLAEFIGATTRYNKSTGVWSLNFGDPETRLRGHSPAIDIETNIDYDPKNRETFRPTVRYNSGQNELMIELSRVKSITAEEDGTLRAEGNVRDMRMVLQVSRQGVPILLPTRIPRKS